MDRFQREFGQRLRELRHRQGLSQERVAAIAGLHKNYVGAIERGTYNVSLKNACKLADAVGVPLAELVQGRLPSRTTPEADTLRLNITQLLRRQSTAKLRTILNVVKELTKSRS